MMRLHREFRFQRLGESEYKLYCSWFRDPETARRISYPDELWYTYVTTNPDVYAWLLYADDLPVGHVQLDRLEEHSASISLVVNPSLRRQGYCRQMLTALLSRPEVQSFLRIEAHVEPDNIGSRRCLAAARFTQQHAEPDADGMFLYVYTAQVEG